MALTRDARLRGALGRKRLPLTPATHWQWRTHADAWFRLRLLISRHRPLRATGRRLLYVAALLQPGPGRAPNHADPGPHAVRHSQGAERASLDREASLLRNHAREWRFSSRILTILDVAPPADERFLSAFRAATTLALASAAARCQRLVAASRSLDDRRATTAHHVSSDLQRERQACHARRPLTAIASTCYDGRRSTTRRRSIQRPRRIAHDDRASAAMSFVTTAPAPTIAASPIGDVGKNDCGGPDRASSRICDMSEDGSSNMWCQVHSLGWEARTTTTRCAIPECSMRSKSEHMLLKPSVTWRPSPMYTDLPTHVSEARESARC